MVSAERRPDRPQTDFTYQQFDWSPTLPDSLFALEPPAGYTEGIKGFVKPGSVPVWRLTTDRADFHVKVWLDAEWDWLQSYIAGCAEVETAALSVGVEMVEPVVLNRPFGASIVAVHQWHEGRTLRSDDDVAAWLGRTMVQLHTIPPPVSAPADSLASWYGVHPADKWREWVAEAEEQQLPWSAAARASLPALLQAGELVGEGLGAGGRLVGSHRDLMHQNILTKGRASYTLIDWDCAGVEVAWLETVRASIEFGRLAGDSRRFDPQPAVMGAIISAYLQVGGEADVRGRGRHRRQPRPRPLAPR